MNFETAIWRMRSPSQMHIICVDVTNKCDLACSNCTRLLENQDAFWEMTPDNFRTALRSLHGYRGIVAMIGGNPCMHRNFEELCEIFRQEVPNKQQRGLWTNNYFKHRQVIEETCMALNDLTASGAAIEVTFYDAQFEDDAAEDGPDSAQARDDFVMYFVGPSPAAIMQVQRDLLVQDTIGLMERHFDSSELGEVVEAIDRLFERRFNDLVSSMQIGRPPRGSGGSSGGHGGGRKPRHLH